MTHLSAMPANTELAIQVQGVNYAYGQGDARTQVLFDNQLKIARGELVILTGPSGSGKLTLLTLIGALRRVQEGAITVLGRDLTRVRAHAKAELRKNIGFIFQRHNLFSSLTAIENVRMATALRRDTVDAMNERCVAILDRLGLADRMNHFPAKLSGGQQQRVAIARALVNQPALVLADEPTASLDAGAGQTVMELLHDMAAGPEHTTVVLITHDQRVIDHADRVVNLVSGRISSNILAKEALRVAQVLARNDIVRNLGLSDATIIRISNFMIVTTVPAGATIVRQGERGDRFHVIGAGTAEALKGNTVVTVLHEGDGFGEISDVSRRTIPITVRARTDLVLYSLEKAEFEKVMALDKSFEERMKIQLHGAAMKMGINHNDTKKT